MSIINKKLLKFEELYRKKALSVKETDGLIIIFKTTKSTRIRRDIAVYLSQIKGDNRIPEKVFKVLKLWDYTDYGSYIFHTYANVFSNYPRAHDKYLKLMFSGTEQERRILSNSLFFVPKINKEIKKIINDFIKHEKDKSIVHDILTRINLKERLKDMTNIINKYDPAGLISKGKSNDIYSSEIPSLAIWYFKNKKDLIKTIKKVFFRRFSNKDILDKNFAKKIAVEWIKKINSYPKRI